MSTPTELLKQLKAKKYSNKNPRKRALFKINLEKAINNISETLAHLRYLEEHLRYLESDIASLQKDNNVYNIPSARRTLKKTGVGFSNRNSSKNIPGRKSKIYKEEQNKIHSNLVSEVSQKYASENHYMKHLEIGNKQTGGPRISKSLVYKPAFNNAVVNGIKTRKKSKKSIGNINNNISNIFLNNM